MRKILIAISAVLLVLAGVAYHQLSSGPQRGPLVRGPAPVEVAPVEVGSIELRRTFSGTLEATARYAVAPRVGGRIVRLAANVADTVERGQLVAEIDDAEFQQAVTQADANLAVARANLTQAESSRVIAERVLDRMLQMHERGVSSTSQLDLARDEQLAKQAAVEVARALVTRAEAALNTAKIRLGYTKVLATWNSGPGQRVVAERFVDEGDTVTANAPLLSIVERSPITAVAFVTERDYGRLQVGQTASLSTDAFPGRSFEGVIARISPVFRAASRQARVELTVPNPEFKLKPGMFARATVVLDRVDNALTVPVAALVKREDQTGVFVVNEAGDRVHWRSVIPGIVQEDRVQVTGEGITGRVVTLGQQLVADGAAISIPLARADGAKTAP